MKVLKKQDTENWTYKHICSGCDSELEVEAKDLRHKRYDGDPREPGYDSYSAQCVVCQSEIGIPENKIPKLIQLEAKNKTSRRSTNYFDR
jgi:hypothetical protein